MKKLRDLVERFFSAVPHVLVCSTLLEGWTLVGLASCSNCSMGSPLFAMGPFHDQHLFGIDWYWASSLLGENGLKQPRTFVVRVPNRGQFLTGYSQVAASIRCAARHEWTWKIILWKSKNAIIYIYIYACIVVRWDQAEPPEPCDIEEFAYAPWGM